MPPHFQNPKVGTGANFQTRPNKAEYYLNIALTVAQRSTCARTAFGAVLTLHDRIISTGYNGSARGLPHCIDANSCNRQGITSRSRYDLCRSVHSESNAISQCCTDVRGSTIYIAGFSRITGEYKLGEASYPCANCFRLMLNAGIVGVWIRDANYVPCYHIIENFGFLEK